MQLLFNNRAAMIIIKAMLHISFSSGKLDSPSPSTRVDHKLMFSIMWLALVWKRALMWS